MHVERQYELSGMDASPDPEVDGSGSHHPPEIHVQPFAGAAGIGSCQVFLQSSRRLPMRRHHGLAEPLNGRSDIHMILSKVLYEQVLHGVVLSEKSPQVTREPEGVDRLKGAVLEPFQSIRIVLRVEIEDELVRPVAHSLAELRHLREDGLAAAPGEEGSV